MCDKLGLINLAEKSIYEPDELTKATAESMQNRIRSANIGMLWRNSLVVWATIAVVFAMPARAQQSGQLALAQQATVPATGDNPSAVQPVDISTDPVPETMFPHFHDTRFWLSGQANFIFQAHPGFHALYSGQNSLSPHYEKATSRVLTLYTGARINDSTEFSVDAEEAGGTALSTGLGLLGNPYLKIVRNPLRGKA